MKALLLILALAFVGCAAPRPPQSPALYLAPYYEAVDPFSNWPAPCEILRTPGCREWL
jgi:hypothetical protein